MKITVRTLDSQNHPFDIENENVSFVKYTFSAMY